MDIGSLDRNKTICRCKTCGWEGPPWSQGMTRFPIEKGKSNVRPTCPVCITETLEYYKLESMDSWVLKKKLGGIL